MPPRTDADLAFDLPDRLRRALRLSDVSAQDMAAQLGVTRQTISRWMSGQGAPPRRSFLISWALITEVPFDWLETGAAEQVSA